MAIILVVCPLLKRKRPTLSDLFSLFGPAKENLLHRGMYM